MTNPSSSLRILYPLSWHVPDERADRIQAINTAAALAHEGHRVTLMVPTPSQGRDLTWRTLEEAYSVTGDVRVVNVRSRASGDSLFNGLRWLNQVFKQDLRHFDLMLCRMPALLGLGRFAPLPFVFDHYRPWPSIYPMAAGIIRNTAMARNCIGFALHSELAAQAYRDIGIDENRLIVAHNGYSAAIGPAADRPGERAGSRSALGLETDEQVAIYAGRINEMKGLDAVLEIARLRPRVRFVLVGSTGEGPIEAAARALPNVTVVGWQSAERLACWINAADVLLIPPSSKPLLEFGNCVLPIKTFSYLAAQRPILAPRLPDTAELLRHDETAWLVEPDQPVLAAEGLDRLLGDPALARRLAANARLLADDLGWDARARLLTMLFRAGLERITTGVSGHDLGRVDKGLQPET